MIAELSNLSKVMLEAADHPQDQPLASKAIKSTIRMYISNIELLYDLESLPLSELLYHYFTPLDNYTEVAKTLFDSLPSKTDHECNFPLWLARITYLTTTNWQKHFEDKLQKEDKQFNTKDNTPLMLSIARVLLLCLKNHTESSSKSKTLSETFSSYSGNIQDIKSLISALQSTKYTNERAYAMSLLITLCLRDKNPVLRQQVATFLRGTKEVAFEFNTCKEPQPTLQLSQSYQDMSSSWIFIRSMVFIDLRYACWNNLDNLDMIDFSGADLTGSNFEGAKYFARARYACFKNVDANKLEFKEKADCTGSHWYKVDLKESEGKGIIFEWSCFNHVKFEDATLLETKINAVYSGKKNKGEFSKTLMDNKSLPKINYTFQKNTKYKKSKKENLERMSEYEIRYAQQQAQWGLIQICVKDWTQAIIHLTNAISTKPHLPWLLHLVMVYNRYSDKLTMSAKEGGSRTQSLNNLEKSNCEYSEGLYRLFICWYSNDHIKERLSQGLSSYLKEMLRILDLDNYSLEFTGSQHQNLYARLFNKNSHTDASSNETKNVKCEDYLNFVQALWQEDTKLYQNLLHYSKNLGHPQFERMSYKAPDKISSNNKFQRLLDENKTSYLEIDVPGNGNCLFSAVILNAFLLALNSRNCEEEYKATFEHLIKRNNEISEDDLRKWLSSYIEKIENINERHEKLTYDIFKKSVKNVRNNVVDYMKKHKNINSQHYYKEYYYEDHKNEEKRGKTIEFDTYCEKMRKDGKWGGVFEIRAIGDILSNIGRTVLVYQKEANGLKLHLEYPENNPLDKPPLRLFHRSTSTNSNDSKKRNHYRFFLTEEDYISLAAHNKPQKKIDSKDSGKISGLSLLTPSFTGNALGDDSDTESTDSNIDVERIEPYEDISKIAAPISDKKIDVEKNHLNRDKNKIITSCKIDKNLIVFNEPFCLVDTLIEKEKYKEAKDHLIELLCFFTGDIPLSVSYDEFSKILGFFDKLFCHHNHNLDEFEVFEERLSLAKDKLSNTNQEMKEQFKKLWKQIDSKHSQTCSTIHAASNESANEDSFNYQSKSEELSEGNIIISLNAENYDTAIEKIYNKAMTIISNENNKLIFERNKAKQETGLYNFEFQNESKLIKLELDTALTYLSWALYLNFDFNSNKNEKNEKLIHLVYLIFSYKIYFAMQNQYSQFHFVDMYNNCSEICKLSSLMEYSADLLAHSNNIINSYNKNQSKKFKMVGILETAGRSYQQLITYLSCLSFRGIEKGHEGRFVHKQIPLKTYNKKSISSKSISVELSQKIKTKKEALIKKWINIEAARADIQERVKFDASMLEDPFIELGYKGSTLYNMLELTRKKLIECSETIINTVPLDKKSIKERIEDIQICNNEFDTLIKQLIENVIRMIGEPPCEFCIGAMGSLGKGIARLYSDFEFFIIIGRKSNNPSEKTLFTNGLTENGYIISYFRLFITFLEYLFISFGETKKPKPCESKNSDKHNSFYPVGFRFSDEGVFPFSDIEKDYNSNSESPHPPSPEPTTTSTLRGKCFISEFEPIKDASPELTTISTLINDIFNPKKKYDQQLSLLMNARCIYPKQNKTLFFRFKSKLNRSLAKTVNEYKRENSCQIDFPNGLKMQNYAAYIHSKSLLTKFAKYTNAYASDKSQLFSVNIFIDYVVQVIEILSLYCGIHSKGVFDILNELEKHKQLEGLICYIKYTILILYCFQVKLDKICVENSIYFENKDKNFNCYLNSNEIIQLHVLAACVIESANKVINKFEENIKTLKYDQNNNYVINLLEANVNSFELIWIWNISKSLISKQYDKNFKAILDIIYSILNLNIKSYKFSKEYLLQLLNNIKHVTSMFFSTINRQKPFNEDDPLYDGYKKSCIQFCKNLNFSKSRSSETFDDSYVELKMYIQNLVPLFIAANVKKNYHLKFFNSLPPIFSDVDNLSNMENLKNKIYLYGSHRLPDLYKPRNEYVSTIKKLERNSADLDGYAHYIMSNKEKPVPTGKKHGIYLYRTGDPEQVFALVVHNKESSEYLDLSKIIEKDKLKEQAHMTPFNLQNLKWPLAQRDKDWVSTKLDKKLENIITSNCKHTLLKKLIYRLKHTIAPDGFSIFMYENDCNWKKSLKNDLFGDPVPVSTKDEITSEIKSKKRDNINSIIIEFYDSEKREIHFYWLKNSIAEKILDEKGRIVDKTNSGKVIKLLDKNGHSYTNLPNEGRHPTLKITLGDLSVHFKFYPEFPSNEILISRYCQRFLGGGVTDYALAFFHYGASKKIPVLITRTVDGIKLKKLLENSTSHTSINFYDDVCTLPNSINSCKFTISLFLRHLLRVLITVPEDDGPHDYFVVKNEIGKVELIRIDNERSFVKPQVPHYIFLTKFNFNSFILCLKCLDEPLNVFENALIQNFLRLDLRFSFYAFAQEIENHINFIKELKKLDIDYIEELSKNKGIEFCELFPTMSIDKFNTFFVQRSFLLHKYFTLANDSNNNMTITGNRLLSLLYPEIYAKYKRSFQSQNPVQSYSELPNMKKSKSGISSTTTGKNVPKLSY